MMTNITVLRPFAESVFYDVIPMEMLRTDAQTPQLELTIDGMAALCNDLSCDFMYTTTDAVMTGFSIDDSDLLTISGANLPNESTDRIFLGPVGCTLTSHSDTEIKCQLDDTRVSGDWKPRIRTEYGLIPSSISSSLVVPVVANSVSPATDVNFLGGDEMTISGDSFGYNTAVVSITYNDGTVCEVTSVSMTSITCINKAFSSGSSGSTQSVTITVNGETHS